MDKFNAAEDVVENIWAASLECLKETIVEGYGIVTDTFEIIDDGMVFMYISDVDGSRVKVTITAKIV